MKQHIAQKDLDYLAGVEATFFKRPVFTEDDYDDLSDEDKKAWKGYSFQMTYQVVSEESAEQGDFEDSGWEYKKGQAPDYDYLDELLNDSDISQKSWLEWSSSPPNPKHDWLMSEDEEDYSSGDRTSYNLWIYRNDGQALSKDEMKYINKELGVR